jgi:hypothetical protein
MNDNQSDPSKPDRSISEQIALTRRALGKQAANFSNLVRDYSLAARLAVKQGVNGSVEATNLLLARLHSATVTLNHQVSESMKGGVVAITKLRHAYQRRQEYGPHIVAGGAVAVAGFVGLRRGRLPGILTGVLTGSVLYVAVYEPYLIENIPDIVFGKRDN